MAVFFSFRFSFSVYKLISRPPDQIIPLITKSFKKTSLTDGAITPLVIGPFFSWQQAIKKKKNTKSKKNK